MKLRIFKEIEKDNWKVTFKTEEFTSDEVNQIAKFGEPEINIGGIFLEGTANEYTLNDEYVKIRSDFPYTKSFDSNSSDFTTNISVKVTAFKDDTVTKLDNAIAALLAETETFTGEEVVTLPTA